MRGDSKATSYPRETPSRTNLTPYWIAGAVITAAAIGCVWMTNNEIHKPAPEAETAYTPPPARHSNPATVSSDSGMHRAGLENTHTPQIGRASGEDGAPKPASPSENPDDLTNSGNP